MAVPMAVAMAVAAAMTVVPLTSMARMAFVPRSAMTLRAVAGMTLASMTFMARGHEHLSHIRFSHLLEGLQDLVDP